MARSPITTVNTTIEVGDVEDIILTDAVQDVDSGEWVREIRIMGLPLNGEEPTNVMTIRVVADERPKLNVTAPEQEF